jgi:ATP-dependent helicase HrpA
MGTDPQVDELRARLGDLTIRDEHRLQRRLERACRDGGDALAKIETEIARAENRAARRRAAVPEVSYPPQLPVSARRDDLLAAIGDNQVVIVAGETGSGKTTQLPKICLELGRGVRGAIGHTQPRRLAARTVAVRIAEELGVELGEAVGYAVRFDDRSREDTLVRLVTDGLLLAEIQNDGLLRRYDTIIVDEAHERSLNIDFLLGYLKGLLPQRPDLKLIITSATIDPDRFSRHFDGAPIVELPSPRAATPSRSSSTTVPATCSSSSAASARSATPPRRSPGACRPRSRSCRSTRACRRASSSASSRPTTRAASCSQRMSPRPR